MKALGWSVLALGGLLLIGLLAGVLFFLYALLLGGPWVLFVWATGLLLLLVMVIKLFTRGALDDKCLYGCFSKPQ